MLPKFRSRGENLNESSLSTPSSGAPRSSLFSIPSFQSSQSAVSWRSPSNNIGVSTPESGVDNCEEDMDLDLSDDRPNTPSCYLWSRTSLAKCSEIDPLTDRFVNSLSYKEPIDSSQSSVVHLSKSMSLPIAHRTEKSSVNEQRAEQDDRHAVTDCDEDSVTLSKQTDGESPALNTDVLDNTENRARKVAMTGCRCVTLILVPVLVAVAALLTCSTSLQCVDELDVSALHGKLMEKVFGQHMAIQSVTGALSDFNEDHSRSTLVMLWHGSTGVGKNYMSEIISEQLPHSYVHKIIVPLHLAHGTVSESRDVSSWIVSNITSNTTCRLHLFVIDEVDKTTPAATEILYATLADLPRLSRGGATRAVILLLSNDGAMNTNMFLSQVLAGGRSRDTVQLSDLQPIMDSMWLTKMIGDKVVDVVVPFLPLEKEHVVQCIEAELALRHLVATQELIQDILNYLQFFPADSELFASTGCRRISYLIDLLA